MINKVAQVKKKMYMGEESPEDVRWLFQQLESHYAQGKGTRGEDSVEITSLYTIIYSFGFKYGLSTFIKKWRYATPYNSSQLREMLDDLFYGLDKLLAKGDSGKSQ